LLRNVDTSYRFKSVTLMAHRIDDAVDLVRRRAVRGLPIGPGRHRTLVGVDASVGQKVQLRVEQLTVQLIQRQATPPAITEDIQYRFGVLHYAYLSAFEYPVTWPPSPVDGLPVLPGAALLARLLRGLCHLRARAP